MFKMFCYRGTLEACRSQAPKYCIDPILTMPKLRESTTAEFPQGLNNMHEEILGFFLKRYMPRVLEVRKKY